MFLRVALSDPVKLTTQTGADKERWSMEHLGSAHREGQVSDAGSLRVTTGFRVARSLQH